MTQPITPEEACKNKTILDKIPDEVIDIFNKLIVKNFNGFTAIIQQEDVVKMIVSKMNVSREEVFMHGWLNVEEIFKSAGWEVIYDKQCYGDITPSHFKFSRKKW